MKEVLPDGTPLTFSGKPMVQVAKNNWFLGFLESKGRKEIIPDREGIKDYLIRYYLIWPDGDKRKWKNIPFNAFIHQFIQSDDPVLHTHPWWFFSLILKGGYWEHLPNGKKWRGPGHFRFAWNSTHWIEIPESGKTWTLFIRGAKRGDWGFINEFGKWEESSSYLARHKKHSGTMS